MKGGIRTDLIIVSIVISVLVHIGTMTYAKPKVMTRVAQGIARVTRRGPMKVTEAREQFDPVKFEAVKDIAADKDAPEAEVTVTAVPTPESMLPATADSEVSIPDVRMPDISTDEIPVDKLPEVIAATASPIAAPEMKMISEATAPLANDPLVHLPPGAPTSDLAISTVAALPVLELTPADLPAAEEELVAKIEKEDEKKDAKEEPAFVPPPEVMATVDESVVAAEKEAVRDLVNAADAGDLAKVVSVGLTCAAAVDGQYFRVTVAPTPDLKPVPKDVVVLIDASGSIGKDRMKSIRGAAKTILRSAANTGDRFNLVAFRDRFSYAFKSWQECTVASFDRADSWLNNVAPYGRTDVFKTISSVLTLPRDPTRPLIALVVTDGDANTGVSDTAQILSQFSKLNDGLVSVYMYGVKSSANRELIDVLTRGNRGDSFIFEGSAWRAGSGIEALSNRFRDPVLTDLRVVFATGCPATAYPRLLKNLYRGETVEFVGRVPNGVKEIAFSLKGLNGKDAYESFFRLPLDKGTFEPKLDLTWAVAHEIDVKLR